MFPYPKLEKEFKKTYCRKMESTTLYRPVGLKALELIAASDWCSFPARLSWQPIFYPVLNREYASQIAQDWNTQDLFSGNCGIVTMFDVDQDYLAKHEVRNVGGKIHDELWIPAEELEEFNMSIIGRIQVIDAFFGSGFIMPSDQVLQSTLSKFLK